MRRLRLMGWTFLASLLFFSSEAWAVPAKDAGHASVVKQQEHASVSAQKQSEKARLLGKRLLAQAEENKQQGQEDPIPGGKWPVGAWVLEGVGAAIIAGGLICFALSAGQLTTRDKLIKEANDDIKNNGGVSDVSAADIKSAEDNGMALNTAGWIVTGVGVGLVVIGAIWMFAHQPPKPKYVQRHVAPSAAPALVRSGQKATQGAPLPAVLFRAGM